MSTRTRCELFGRPQNPQEKGRILTASGTASAGESTSITRVGIASLIGTTIEWYDYFLYGTAAALVFGPLFFPDFSPLAGTLASFATFAVGFLARPVGAVVFGHFGDRIGRKTTLIATLLLMGVATFLIGCLPTYDSIGIFAPLSLVVLRIFQGLGLGGEWGGAVLLAVEHSPSDKRGFYGSWPQIGVPVGLLLATGVFAAVSSLPQEQFLAWGWRLPFLLSVLLVGVGLFIRFRIYESPAFTQVKESRTEAQLPILDVLRTHPKNVLLAAGTRLGTDVVFYTVSVFSLTYLSTNLGVPNNVGLTAVLIAAALGIFTVPAFGALSDRLGRRPVILGGAVFMGLWIFPFFWLLNTESLLLVTLAAVVMLNVGWPATYATIASFYAEMFSTRIRYSGSSLGFQLSGILGGALAPIISVSLLAWSGGSPWPIALYVAAVCSISVACVYLAAETYQSDISKPYSRERRIIAEKSTE